MSLMEQVVNHSKALETMLVKHFGAEGRGLHEKLTSVEHRIPIHLQRRIRFVATLRNKLLHEDGFQISDPERFLLIAGQAVSGLRTLCSSESSTETGSPESSESGNDEDEDSAPKYHQSGPEEWYSADKKSNIGLYISWISVFFIGYLGYLWWDYSEIGVTLFEKHRSVKIDTTSTVVKAEEHKPVDTFKNFKVQIQNFYYESDLFGQMEPHIKVMASNTSDFTISSARLKATMYINGMKIPVLTTSSRKESIYLHFGDYGLKAGESVQKTIGISGFNSRDWRKPDIMNASSRTLVLEVIEVRDGMNQPVSKW